MSKTKQRVFLCFELVLVLLCGWGIMENLLQNSHFNMEALSFYTIQSNILCFIYFLSSLLWNLINLSRGKEIHALSPRFESAVVFAIAVTMLIFNFLLVPIAVFSNGVVKAEDVKGFLTPINMLPHEVVPVLALLDWCLFVPKGKLRKKDPLIWLVIPYAYFLFAIVRAQAGAPFEGGSYYPYPFIDADVMGWPMVILIVAVITAVFLGIAYAYVALDGKLGKKAKLPQKQSVSA